MEADRRTPCLLWPFVAIWDLLTFILRMTGRLIAILLGFVLMVVGVLLSLTVIGAFLGVPLAIFGFMLILRGIF